MERFKVVAHELYSDFQSKEGLTLSDIEKILALTSIYMKVAVADLKVLKEERTEAVSIVEKYVTISHQCIEDISSSIFGNEDYIEDDFIASAIKYLKSEYDLQVRLRLIEHLVGMASVDHKVDDRETKVISLISDQLID